MSSRTCSLCVCVAIGAWLLIVGCASLPKRIAATHLSCKTYPKLVDGDLATNSFLKVKGFIEKDNTAYKHSLRYGDWVEGKHKTEALIQLDTLTNVAYIEVHPVSTIYRLSVETSTAERAHGKTPLFEPVRSHKIARSESGGVMRIDIDRPVRVLRVSIYANRDSAHDTRESLTGKTKVSFKDVVIREIRVYRDGKPKQ
ncbi:hypothetical protein C6499_22290 [Candidatus Poribacteria bacterium]|nr:MAG: hypothetical protein C6499_22290 [Candidatus Poribacteria bacterium]